MKALKHIFSGTIWGVVALYLSLMLVIQLPAPQRYLGKKLSEAIGAKLGTQVSIGRVDLGFLNRVIIDDVLIRDRQQEDLLHVGRLSVRIELLPLAEGRISIASAQIFGAHAHLYKNSEEEPFNFQFALDSLASNDTTDSTPLNLRINSLIVRHSSIDYDRDYKKAKIEQFDVNHLKFSGISAHVILKTLRDDSLNVNLKRLAFREKSGVQVTRFSMQLNAGIKGARVKELSLQLPHSHLCIDSMSATYDTAHFQQSLQYAAIVSSQGIAPKDFACFFPKLKDLPDIAALQINVAGTATNLQAPKISLSAGNGNAKLRASAWVRQLDRQPSWHAEVSNLSLSEEMLATLQKEIKGLPEELTRLGSLQLTGTLDGFDNGNMGTACRLTTGVGDLDLHFNLSKEKTFNGRMLTNEFDLSRLLDSKDFGTLACAIDLEGSKQDISVKGTISKLSYKNYTYHNIDMNGNYSRDRIAGKLKIDDPNIQTSVEGEWRKQSKNINMLKMSGLVRNLKPSRLNLSQQWGDATFCAAVDADITANTLNDAQGTIDLNNFVMTDSLTTFRIDNIHLQSGYTDDKHFVRLNGDMGEAELQGQFDWSTLPNSFATYMASKLPTLPGLPKTAKSSENDFDISVRLNSTEWLRHLFSIPLILEQPLRLEATVDDKKRDIKIDGTLPAFSYDGVSYRDASIQLTTLSDTMKCSTSFTKQSSDGTSTGMSLTASAADNSMRTNLAWRNEADDIKGWNGKLNATTSFYNNEGKPEAHIHVQHSSITIDGAEWAIQPSDIVYSDKRLLIDHFSIEHGDQHLTIDGIASQQPTDTLCVDLKEIGVDYVLNLVNFHSVEFAGKASGKAYLTQLFDQPDAWANITVDDFLFEQGRMGTLFANVDWDNDKGQIDISATADDGTDAMTYVEGYVSLKRKYIDLDIHANGTYIDFMNSFTSSFLSNATGHSYGSVKLAGPLSTINLTGQLVVDGQATVTALGTTYTLKQDTVNFIPDDIQLDSVPIYDRFGQKAYLSGGIHHEHLTHLTFDLEVATDRLLAYDFSDFDDGSFYGTVFTQGLIALHGRPGEVIIDCDVTPLQGTTFTYNAASSNSISKQEFITWRNKQAASQASSSAGHEDMKGEEPSSNLFLNLLINTTPQAEIRLLMDPSTDDYITLHGSGVIRASFHNKGAFHMFGTYTIADGTYGITIQNIIKKNFIFMPEGTITFGGNPMDANLNLQARYTVNGVSLSDLSIGNSFNNTVRVDCLMNILGLAGAPRIEFDFDLPNVNSEEKQMIRSLISSEQETNQQVLYLLGIGRFYTQGANNADANQEYGQTQLAMQSFLSGTLSAQINEMISQMVKNGNWNFGANISTGNEGWHNAEYEGIVSGRMFNNRLLINGQFGYRDNATRATPSFIGDFDLRYLLYPNGNLALKVYNQANDRYFTHSSLNTQGIGLIMKRDFNGLSELLAPKRKKTKKIKKND